MNAALHGNSKSNPLTWVNILSLDAPIVALVWQAFFSEIFEVEISLSARIVLGLTVWLAYVADRWMDGRMLPNGAAVTLRHQFAQKNARAIAFAWGMVFVGDVLLALIGLASREFFFGLAVAVLAAAYLAAVHLHSFRKIVGPSKEVLVALLFSAGASVFVLAELQDASMDLLVSSFVFFGLCLVNCILVSSWERSEDAQQAQPSMAIHWKLTPTSARWIALVGLVSMAVLSYFTQRTPVGWTAAASGSSFFLLVTLEMASKGLALNQRRVLADAALLTPVVIMILLRDEL